MFKCEGDAGVPMYQEFPCAAGKELRNFDSDPPPISVIPGASMQGNAGASSRPNVSPPAKSQEATSAKAKRSVNTTDAGERRHAHGGMTEGEVLAKYGRPDITAGNSRKTRGRWTYLPAAGDPDTITTFQIDKGVVVDVDRKTVKR